MKKLFLFLLVILHSLPVLAEKVKYTVNYPSKVNYKLERVVVFNPGFGLDDFVNKLSRDLTKKSVEVIPNQPLPIDTTAPDTTPEKILDAIKKTYGDVGLIFISKSQGGGSKFTNKKNNEGKVIYKNTTTVNLTYKITITDLATMKTLDTLSFSESKSASKSSEVYNEVTSAPKLKPIESAINSKISKRFVTYIKPKSKQKKMLFYSDKWFDSKKSYKAFKKGKIDEGFGYAKASLEAAIQKPDLKTKVLARQYFNVGAAHLVKGEFDLAIEHINKAREVKDERKFKKYLKYVIEAKEAKVRWDDWNSKLILVGGSK